MKKSLALLLALLCSASCFLACGQTEEEKESNDGIESGNESVNQETEPETEPEETQSKTPNWDAVDKTSLGGITINIVDEAYNPDSYYTAIDFEAKTGDVLDDAVYDRNRLLESTLDCTMAFAATEDVRVTVEQAVDNGDGSIDLVYIANHPSGTLLVDGRLLPFEAVKTVDLTQPWWDTPLLDGLKVFDVHYYGFMDFEFSGYDKMHLMLYNGTVLAEYPELANPYELYKNSQWTMENALEMAKAVGTDVNEDGTMDIAVDKFGLVGTACERMPMVHSSGYRTLEWSDENGQFMLQMLGNERYAKVMEMIVAMRGKPASAFNANKKGTGITAFGENRALLLGTDVATLRNLDASVDYGVVPHPRYDYTAGSYNLVYGIDALCFPIDIGDDNNDGADDYNEVGIFLQAAGAYTYDVLKDLYFEKAIPAGAARAEQNKEVFFEMIESRSVDVSFYFQEQNYSQVVNLHTDNNEGFYEAAEKDGKVLNAYGQRISASIQAQLDLIKDRLN